MYHSILWYILRFCQNQYNSIRRLAVPGGPGAARFLLYWFRVYIVRNYFYHSYWPFHKRVWEYTWLWSNQLAIQLPTYKICALNAINNVGCPTLGSWPGCPSGLKLCRGKAGLCFFSLYATWSRLTIIYWPAAVKNFFVVVPRAAAFPTHIMGILAVFAVPAGLCRRKKPLFCNLCGFCGTVFYAI